MYKAHIRNYNKYELDTALKEFIFIGEVNYIHKNYSTSQKIVSKGKYR